jgi:hypothetical protein
VAADEAGVRQADAPGAADRFEAQEAFCREAHQDFHEKQVVGEGDAGSRRRRYYPAAFLRASPPMIHLLILRGFLCLSLCMPTPKIMYRF